MQTNAGEPKASVTDRLFVVWARSKMRRLPASCGAGARVRDWEYRRGGCGFAMALRARRVSLGAHSVNMTRKGHAIDMASGNDCGFYPDDLAFCISLAVRLSAKMSAAPVGRDGRSATVIRIDTPDGDIRSADHSDREVAGAPEGTCGLALAVSGSRPGLGNEVLRCVGTIFKGRVVDGIHVDDAGNGELYCLSSRSVCLGDILNHLTSQ